MTITTSINNVGIVRATEMMQTARAEAAIEHRPGLHTVTVAVPEPDSGILQLQENSRDLPASQKRAVDISV
ncbi:hypothetical protein [Methylobacterium brachiatum]|uniref:hypothetical protein n=1 Tax=Methylobacterium brachiatum TaxID=269660 RepID=UPI000EFD413C|nr:hypothetical protein [Methylobacterium brachiatum]AYO83691.1 hypothetical protein EBB05_16385 [Methylobacterium brachiatum]